MKSLTIVAVILATAQSLLAQEPRQKVCCDVIFVAFDQKFSGVGCVPMVPDCVPSG
jgi:hypothetical protein